MSKKEAKRVSDWQLETFRVIIKRLDNGLLFEITDGNFMENPPVPNVARAFGEADWDYIMSEAERYMRHRIAAIRKNMAEEATE